MLDACNKARRKARLSIKRVESIMQTFKNWPNASVAAIGAAALFVVFLLSIVTSPGAHRTDVTRSSQPSDPVTVGAIPQSGLREEQYIDYMIIFLQNSP